MPRIWGRRCLDFPVFVLRAARPGGAASFLFEGLGAGETADAYEVIDLFTPDSSDRSRVFREPFLGMGGIRQYGSVAPLWPDPPPVYPDHRLTYLPAPAGR